MKVLLIDPPFERLIGMRYDWYPLALGYLASSVKAKGHDVLIYEGEHDAQIPYREHTLFVRNNYDNYFKSLNNNALPVWNEIRKVIKEYNPDVVGITILCVKIESALKIAEICKEINSNMFVIAGGQYPTSLPEDILASKYIDYVIRGEGETVIQELLESIENENINESVHTINGLSYKVKNDFIHNTSAGFIKDLDAIPFPATKSLYMRDSYTPSQLSIIMASRGCPYNCSYCASKNMWSGKVRYRSAENVIKEIEYLRDTYSLNHFTFMDDCFTLNKKWLGRFCTLIKEKELRITWSCLSSVTLIDEDIVKMLKGAGCIKVSIGVESGSERILKLANKKITPEAIARITKLLKKYDIPVSVYAIIGFPTETAEEMRVTQKFILDLKPDWIYGNVFTPYPGTDLYDYCVKNNIIDKKLRFSMYSHQSSHNNFTGTMNDEEFRKISKEIMESFVSDNKKLIHVIKRGIRKNYIKNPESLLTDIKKAYNWYVGSTS